MSTTTHVPQSFRKRLGLFKLRPGLDQVTKCRNGKNAQFTCRERREAPDAKVVWRCNGKECKGKEWADEETLLRSHPEKSVMQKQEEDHCYYAFSNDPDVKRVDAHFEAFEPRIAAILTLQGKEKTKEEREKVLKMERDRVAPFFVIGVLSDES